MARARIYSVYDSMYEGQINALFTTRAAAEARVNELRREFFMGDEETFWMRIQEFALDPANPTQYSPVKKDERT